ncbi:MAG: methylglyoxal synthase [Clostridia bacterium]|nr:methylglyoxal synthase [Clostridia bacterium]
MLNIALMAHDKRKELMVQFCITYCRILSKHKVCATAVTGKIVSEATGLEVDKLMSRSNGGAQQIASRIANNEVDLLIYFRDTSHTSQENDDDMTLLRICDVHNIPVATNIATAEVLVRALERGDLDWKEVYNITKKKPGDMFSE